jgi:hypothetical protein
MKKCFKCGKEKPLDEFYRHRQMMDGHLNKCKECTKKDSNKYRAENLDKCRAYDRKRSSLPHRVSLRKKVTKTWIEDGRHTATVTRYRKRHPDRYRAHNKVNNATRNSKLERITVCSRCGMETKNIQGHHPDYTRPLYIEWLCPECHGKEHRKYSRSEAKETVTKQSGSI